MTGAYEEYFGVSEIDIAGSPYADVTVGAGTTSIAPEPVRTGALSGAAAERWEGVHVRVDDVTVDTVEALDGDFYVVDGIGGAVEVSDFTHTWSLFPPTLGASLSSISGPLHYDDSTFTITPRSDAHLVP